VQSTQNKTGCPGWARNGILIDLDCPSFSIFCLVPQLVFTGSPCLSAYRSLEFVFQVPFTVTSTFLTAALLLWFWYFSPWLGSWPPASTSQPNRFCWWI
jgi:hypothetical protein